MMTYEPSATQALFLWRLATAGGEDWKKDIKPDLKTAQRKALISHGFIRERRERNPATKGVGLVCTLEDSGWLWLREHLDRNLKGTSTAGGEILGRLLTRLKAFVEASEIDLADILCHPETAARTLSRQAQSEPTTLPEPPTQPEPATRPDPAPVNEESVELADRIQRAYFQLAPNGTDSFVRLADLRAALSDVRRSDLDETLWRMAHERQLVLYPLNNPQEIRAADEEAALQTAVGEPRHVVMFYA